MFNTRMTFLEYIFLLHGSPAVLRKKKSMQLLLHFISRFLLQLKVITLAPRGDDSNALSLPKWEDSPADCSASNYTNYPPHVVHPQAFNLGPQLLPCLSFLLSFSWQVLRLLSSSMDLCVCHDCAEQSRERKNERKEWWRGGKRRSAGKE